MGQETFSGEKQEEIESLVNDLKSFGYPMMDASARRWAAAMSDFSERPVRRENRVVGGGLISQLTVTLFAGLAGCRLNSLSMISQTSNSVAADC